MWASGVFELQVLELSVPRARLPSGRCCGGGGEPCALPCRAKFALCLKEYQASAAGAGGAGAAGGCSFGRATSPALGEDSFTLAEPLYTLALPFTFRWTVSCTHCHPSPFITRTPRIALPPVDHPPVSLQRSFTLILQAFDDYNYTEPGECTPHLPLTLHTTYGLALREIILRIRAPLRFR